MSEIKLCKDCKHYTERTGNFTKLCAVGKIEPVMGQLDETCGLARTPYGSCGIEAKNFEQKPETRPDALKFDMNPLPIQPAGLSDFVEPVRPWWKFWGKA